MADWTPQSRAEEILFDTINGEPYDGLPQSRMEELLLELKDVVESGGGGGGGGGGVKSYTALTNKPRINNVELTGNKTTTQLGLEGTLTWDDVPTSGSNHPVRSKGIYTALANKVDKETGKGLSQANYTNEEKTKLGTIESGAQANIIERITLNGVIINPVNKEVALQVMTRTVNNLQNYYLKSEVYTQEEVNTLINSIASLTLDIVPELPTTDISTTTIYLVEISAGSNVYMQYAYINNAWAQLGTTQVDLSNYYTKPQIEALLDDKQDVIEVDEEPTAGSDNPVASGGVYNALSGKQDTLEWDSTPTEDSTKPVTSGGVYAALATKQDTLEFDEEPTAGSDNMVTSGAIAEAIDNVSVPVASNDIPGIVKPDGITITVDDDGTLHGSSGIDPNEDDFDFTEGVLSLQVDRRMWTGTQAEWDALSTAQRQEYGVANITDDESGTETIVKAAVDTNNKIEIRRIGKLYSLEFRGYRYTLSTSTADTVLELTLPDGFRPTNIDGTRPAVWGCIYSSDHEATGVTIGSNGRLILSHKVGTATIDVYGTVTWIEE